VPKEGAPATERTEAWILFDRRESLRLGPLLGLGTAGPMDCERAQARHNQLRQNDTFGVIFDTFHDRRNGFLFYTNPLGGEPIRR